MSDCQYTDYWEGLYMGHFLRDGDRRTENPPNFHVLLRAKRPCADLGERASRYWMDRPPAKVIPNWITFHNEDSGCFFEIRLRLLDSKQSPKEQWRWPGPAPEPNQLVVWLRTLQPHVYSREVTETLEPMVRALDLEMALPDDPDPAFGSWSASRVLLAWRNFNRKTLANWRQAPYNLESFVGRLPGTEIERIWEWNRSRSAREAALEEDVYIPLIHYLDLGDGPQTRVSWPDGIPIYLPKVDFILAGFDEVPDAPPGTRALHTWTPWEAIEPLLSRYPTLKSFPDARRLAYDEPPSDLLEVLRNGLRVRQVPWTLPFARVLAEEDFRDGPDPHSSA